MKHRYSFLVPYINLITDLILLNLSFILGYFIRFQSLAGISQKHYLLFWLFLNLAYIILKFILRPYDDKRVTDHSSFLITRFITVLLIHATLVSLFFTVTQANFYSRLHLVYTYSLFFVFGVIWRWIFVSLLQRYRKAGKNTRSYIVIGGKEKALTIIRYHELHPELGFRLLKHFDDLENPTILSKFSNDYRIDYIYCYESDFSEKELQMILDFADSIGAQVSLFTKQSFIPNKIAVEYHSYIPVFKVLSLSFYQSKETLLKRSFDVLFSSLALILGSPLFLFVAITTAFSSRGPVFFKQTRTGRLGKTFTIYKFRSMYIHADERHSEGAADQRITSWGRIMRKTRLDELPQFFNVLKGDMSVVGPRPLAGYDSKILFSEMPLEYRILLSFKPGLTSLGQIHYGYAGNAKEIKERAYIDLKYIPSFRKDCTLILQTVQVMFSGKGI